MARLTLPIIGLLLVIGFGVDFGQGAVASSTAVVAPELIEKAVAEGRVRVLVEVRVLAAPGEVHGQAIRRAQQAVLDEIAGTPHRVVRTYLTVPLIALQASAETLTVLASSPNVLSVQEDSPASPQSRATLGG